MKNDLVSGGIYNYHASQLVRYAKYRHDRTTPIRWLSDDGKCAIVRNSLYTL